MPSYETRVVATRTDGRGREQRSTQRIQTTADNLDHARSLLLHEVDKLYPAVEGWWSKDLRPIVEVPEEKWEAVVSATPNGSFSEHAERVVITAGGYDEARRKLREAMYSRFAEGYSFHRMTDPERVEP